MLAEDIAGGQRLAAGDVQAALQRAGRQPAAGRGHIGAARPATGGGVVGLERRQIAGVAPAAADDEEPVVEHRHGEMLPFGR